MPHEVGRVPPLSALVCDWLPLELWTTEPRAALDNAPPDLRQTLLYT